MEVDSRVPEDSERATVDATWKRWPNMEDTISEVDSRQRFFDEIIRARMGADVELSWGCKEFSETHFVFTTTAGNKRMLLRISQDAFDQAVGEPASIPRLTHEVEQQLKLSETGEVVGCVTVIRVTDREGELFHDCRESCPPEAATELSTELDRG